MAPTRLSGPVTASSNCAKTRHADIESTRASVLQSRQDDLATSTQALRSLLSEAYWVLQDKNDPSGFGTGTESGQADDQAKEVFIARFITGGESVEDLEWTVPSPQLTPADGSLPVDAVMQPDAIRSSRGHISEASVQASSSAMDIEEVVQQNKTATFQESIVLSAPGLSRDVDVEPSPAIVTSPQKSLSIPPHLRIVPPIDAVPLHSPTVNPALLGLSPPKASTIASASGSTSLPPGLRISPIRPEYPHHLPPVPLQYVVGRTHIAQPSTAAQLKAAKKKAGLGIPSGVGGVWGGSGYTETLRVLVNAQHAGIKLALGKRDEMDGRGRYEKPRVTKVLSTQEWRLAFAELKQFRALERIERLKAERQWSFRQMKKQRMPAIPKAHWDHVLDEVAWLQTDFRQERRWKMATAHNIAVAVQQWHDANEEEKIALQVRTVAPTVRLATHQSEAGPSGTSGSELDQSRMMEVDEGSGYLKRSVDVDGDDGEADAEGEDESPAMSRRASEYKSTPPSAVRKPDDNPPPSRRTTVNPGTASSTDSTARAQRVKKARKPIFNIPVAETMFTLGDLDDSAELVELLKVAPENVTLQQLFSDLPLYGDMDARPDRRADWSSPSFSRLAHVSARLESKPLLVSTLNPGSNLVKKRSWQNLEHLSTEDVRELTQPTTYAPPSQLFNARKPKDLNLATALNPPPADKISESRPMPLAWTELDDAELDALVKQCSYNWRAVAELFSSVTKRRTCDQPTPRECYDRWVKVFGPVQGASEQTPDGEAVPTDTGGPAAAAAARRQAMKQHKLAPPEPPRRLARSLALQEATRRARKKRETEERRREPITTPRQINLNAHETHAQPYRPLMTPMQMSAMKADRDRQQVAAAEMARRQIQMQAEQRRAAAMASQGQGSQSQINMTPQQQQARAMAVALANGRPPPPGQRFANGSATPPIGGSSQIASPRPPGSQGSPPIVPQVPSMGQNFQMPPGSSPLPPNRTGTPQGGMPGQPPLSSAQVQLQQRQQQQQTPQGQLNGAPTSQGLNLAAVAQQLGMAGGQPAGSAASVLESMRPDQIAQLRAALANRGLNQQALQQAVAQVTQQGSPPQAGGSGGQPS